VRKKCIDVFIIQSVLTSKKLLITKSTSFDFYISLKPNEVKVVA